MGCGSSMDVNAVTEEAAAAAGVNGLSRLQQNGMNPIDVVAEFVRLDEQISKLEATCPGPRLATAEAWVEHLQGKRNGLLGIEGLEATTYQRQELQQQQKQHYQQEQQHLQQQQQREQNHNHHHHPQQNHHPQQQQQLPTQQPIHQQQNGYVVTQNDYGNDPTTTATTAVGTTSNGLPNGLGVANGNGVAAKTPSEDLANLALNLGVVGDARKASSHEDFFANLSESALHLTSIRYYTEVLEHTKVRLKSLADSYAELNELYVNHDGIIALISGGTYMTRLEESIDAQLETARDIRDKLGSTLEQWRICGLLLRACANSATLALQQWRSLTSIVTPKEKIQSALQCRSTLQASLISLDCAQLSLPHVEIKYISNRQTLAVRHCNTYMITDIADKARYEHTTKVIVAYESNMSKASTWLYETFNKTLRKDFDKAEETVRHLAKTLRDHREEVFTSIRT